MNSYIVSSLIGGSIKKYFAVTLATLAFVLALPVMAVFAMGEDVVGFLSGSPSAISAEDQGFYMGGPVEGDTYAWGNCTYWAFAQRLWIGKPIPTTWGNANTWDDRAIVDGYLVDHNPKVGAVMQIDEGSLGHVAYVTSVDSETGKWVISEMNAPHLNVVSTRTFESSASIYYNFIHDKIKVTP
ncbi:MAG: CHAP domain-containing protein [Candidatus Saccharibacteria bacterium]